MSDPGIAALIIRLIIGSVAAFLAILLWSRTRDAAWMLVIIGIIIEYGKILFTALQFFGFVSSSFFIVNGLEIGKIVLDNLPTIFICSGIILMVIRTRYK